MNLYNNVYLIKKKIIFISDLFIFFFIFFICYVFINFLIGFFF